MHVESVFFNHTSDIIFTKKQQEQKIQNEITKPITELESIFEEKEEATELDESKLKYNK